MVEQSGSGHLAQGQRRDHGHDAPAAEQQAQTEQNEQAVFNHRAQADVLHLFSGREHGAAPVSDAGEGQKKRQHDDDAQGSGIGTDQPGRTGHQQSARHRARQTDDKHMTEIAGRRGGILRRVPRQHRREAEAGDQLKKAHQGKREGDRPEKTGAEKTGEQDPEQR